MKPLIVLILFFTASCCHSKKASTNNQAENSVATETGAGLPACMQEMIKKYSALQKHERPSKIYSYNYKGKTVYYVVAPCCDNFNELYNDSCKLIGHPDGGFTGRGDGTMPDWQAEKKEEKLVWEDIAK